MNPGNVDSRRLCACFIGLCLMVLSYGLERHGYAQATDARDLTASSQPEGNVYSLAGTVVNSETWEPIRRAAVEISGQANRVTLTDNAGHFEFDGLAEGRVLVGATKPGFSDEQGMPYGRTAVQVARDPSPVLLKITPAGVIAGRVTTLDAQPLEGFHLHVITKQNVNGQQIWLDCPFQAQTDENGDFRISSLPAGTYYIAVDQSQETTLSQRGLPNARQQGYAKVFYPGVSEFSVATPLELRPGREVEANLALAAEPIYQVSGGVSTQESLTPSLVFLRKNGEGYDFTQTAPMQEGKFQTKLPAGSYRVNGWTVNGVQLSTSGASVVISSDSPDVHITMSPIASIQVEVQTEHVGGSAQRSLPEQGGIPGMNLQLVSSAPLHRSTNWWRAPSGGIQNVEPGVYTVDINTAGQWWVKSVRCGGVDLLTDDLTVADGVQPPPIEVTLRDDAAAVGGTVVPAEETEPATVLLVQPRSHRNIIKALRTMQGKFQFQGVPPGDYALFALDHADQLEYANPEVLNPYLSKAEHISLQPHGTASVKLTLSPIRR